MDNEQPKNDAPCKRCGQEPYPDATRECIKRGTGECELAMREEQTVSRVETGKPDPPAPGDYEIGMHVADQAHAIRKLFRKVFGAVPIYLSKNAPAPAPTGGFKGELNAHLAAITDEQLRAEFESAGRKFTEPDERPDIIMVGTGGPPAARPTPITGYFARGFSTELSTDEVNDVLDHIDTLERQLAEARAELDHLKSHTVRIERFFEVERLLRDARAECEEQARLLGMSVEREARLIAERDTAMRRANKLAAEALALTDQRDVLVAAFGEWPRLREWLEMDPFVRGYISAELAAFDAMSAALAAVKGGQGE